jgi:hypothetical protein
VYVVRAGAFFQEHLRKIEAALTPAGNMEGSDSESVPGIGGESGPVDVDEFRFGSALRLGLDQFLHYIRLGAGGSGAAHKNKQHPDCGRNKKTQICHVLSGSGIVVDSEYNLPRYPELCIPVNHKGLHSRVNLFYLFSFG